MLSYKKMFRMNPIFRHKNLRKLFRNTLYDLFKGLFDEKKLQILVFIEKNVFKIELKKFWIDF